jgi:ABC-type multidrug transport system ATPase subunit
MAQRINFIIALLSKPQILLLDEPTSGIDSPVANLFLLKLKEFVTAENHCIIMVTHDLLFAEKISGSIAVLDKGKLSGFHPADEFINIPEYFPGIHG